MRTTIAAAVTLLAVAAWFAFTAAAAEAGKPAVMTKQDEIFESFEGAPCGSDTQRLFVLGRNINNLRATTFPVGSRVADYGGAGGGVVTAVEIGASGKTINWTVSDTPEGCAAYRSCETDPNEFFCYGDWSTKLVTMKGEWEAAFRIKKLWADDGAQRILKNRYSFWRSSNSYKNYERCRGGSAEWKCKLFFGAGDTYLKGKMRMRVIQKRPGQRPIFKGRWRLKQFDEYCRIVNEKPKKKCTEYRRGSGSVNVPGFLLP